VLINLLSNAIKFTPAPGRVTLKVGFSSERGIIISVTDSGIGIPSDEVQNMLSPFAQVDSDLNRKYEGTGLGLPIAKSLTEQMGGTFHLESEEGRGTCAIITFPNVGLCEMPSKESYKLAS
jgi:signal transduction histidine kinase